MHGETVKLTGYSDQIVMKLEFYREFFFSKNPQL